MPLNDLLSKEAVITVSTSIFTNNATVSGGGILVGGFVGLVDSSDDLSFYIVNSANKGGVLAKNGIACGLICVFSEPNINANYTIENSINKGDVNAENRAYGIANIVTSARNVVSMGNVTGKSESYTFWNEFTDVDLFYGMKDKCINCSADATLFEYDESAECFVVVSTRDHMHTLLNDEALERDYGMLWTTELDLVNPSMPFSSSSSSSSAYLSSSSTSPMPTSSQSGQLSGGIRQTASWLSILVAFVLTAHLVFSQ